VTQGGIDSENHDWILTYCTLSLCTFAPTDILVSAPAWGIGTNLPL